MIRSRTKPLAAVMGLVFVVAVSACSGGVSTNGATGPAPTTPATAAPSTTAAPPPAKPSPGCGTSTTRAVDKEQRNLDVNGTDRFYLLTTPAAHDGKTPLPLVVDLHGLAEGAQVHTEMSKFGDEAKKEGFVVVFPNGMGSPVHWTAAGDPAANPDVAFLDKMLDTLGTDLCIDTSRVYSTGLSYGAIMSSYLTCVRADRFAAVAPVAGITVPPSGCTPSRPMPVLAFHGTADPILLFNGGVDLKALGPKTDDGATTTTKPADLNGPGYPANVAAWAARNGCKPTPTDTKVTPDVTRRVYDCPANAAVEFYIIAGGGHAWPGSAFSQSIAKVVGPTNMDINATDLIWQFFKRFSLPN